MDLEHDSTLVYDIIKWK